MEIRVDDLSGNKVKALIMEHLNGMLEGSPPESVHALNLEGLKKPGITFWSAWDQDELLGCGALKELDATHGEIKSMRTSSLHLRKGVARQILEHIIEVAEQRHYKRLSLETGSMESFEPARRLYESVGFHYCAPFADYTEDPYSVFMTKELYGPHRTREIIENYIEAYNSFDVEGMIQRLHSNVVFRNFSNSELNTETKGIEEFSVLAEQSVQLFSSRRQTIVNYTAAENQVEVQIDYEGTLAVDLPNGLKAGDKLQLKGKSIFEIREGKIVWIEDYS